MPLPPTNIFEVPDQGPLFTGFDTLWESMQVLGYAWSGLPYRPAGHLTSNGDLWQSMQSDLGTEFTSGSMGLARSLDQRNFSFNSSLIATKIMASLPGGMGNDPKTKATVLQIANYAAKYGPMVLSSLRANLGGDNDPTGAMGVILDTAESALDAMYGPMGSIASAQSILSGSMRNTVDLYRRDTRLQTYIKNKYGGDGKTLGYTARKEASYLALEAQRGVNTGLNISNDNAIKYTSDYLLNPINTDRIEYLKGDLALQKATEFRSNLMSGAAESRAIDSLIESRGYNAAQTSAYRNYATQLNGYENLQKDIIATGAFGTYDKDKPFSSYDPSYFKHYNNWTGMINAMSAEQERLRGIDNPEAKERLEKIEGVRKRLESLRDAQDAATKAGLSKTDIDSTRSDLDKARTAEIAKALNKNGITDADTVADLTKAIDLRTQLEQRGINVDDLATVEAREEFYKGDKDEKTKNLVRQFFKGDSKTGSYYSRSEAFFKSNEGIELAKINAAFSGFTEAAQQGQEALQKWIAENPEYAAIVEDGTTALQATERNSMKGYSMLEAAFSATNSTIGGQAITSPEQVHQIANMFLQSNWGHFSNEDRDTEFARIGYGMMASNTNAEQAVQYAGQAAKAAKEVGANVTTASVYGVQEAMSAKQWALKNNISSELLPSLVGRAAGLAPKTLFGRGLNAVLFGISKDKVNQIQDKQTRAIVQKALNQEQLTIEEMQYLEGNAETALQDVGYTDQAIRAMEEMDHSNQGYYKYSVSQATRSMLAGSKEDLLDGMNISENTLREAGSKSAFKNEAIQKVIFEAAFNKDNLKAENAEELKQQIIREAKKAGATDEELRDLKRIDAKQYTLAVNSNMNHYKAVNNLTSDEDAIALRGYGKNTDTATNNQLAADLYSSLSKGETNAFSRALAELKNNPNATLADLLKVAKSHNLDDKEKQRLATVASLGGMLGDANFNLGTVFGEEQTKSQEIFSKLVKGTGSAEVAEQLIRNRITGELSDSEKDYLEFAKEAGDFSDEDFEQLVSVTKRGYEKAISIIDKKPEGDSTEINANEVKTPGAIIGSGKKDDSKGGDNDKKGMGSLPIQDNAVVVYVKNVEDFKEKPVAAPAPVVG